MGFQSKEECDTDPLFREVKGQFEIYEEVVDTVVSLKMFFHSLMDCENLIDHQPIQFEL